MIKPIVVIVGRQNVGKSTLFNRITGRRAAIVKDEPGVTRDRMYADATWEGKQFILVDTGGFLAGNDDEIIRQVKEHALDGIEEADLVIHLFDGREGFTPGDRELADVIRKYNKKVLWVVNKIDTPRTELLLSDFYDSGQSIVPVSAEHGLGFDEMMDTIVKEAALEDIAGEEMPDIPKVAIVGRPNVGKSTIVNKLLGKERMIVSSVAGTTRDAIDSVCTYYGKKYVLIDTAGIRRKARVVEDIERFSVVRAIRSIERADVVVFMTDAGDGIVEQDKKIVQLINSSGKGLILLVNKWDIVEDRELSFEAYMALVQREFPFVPYAPVLTVSGLTGQRATKIFPLIDDIMAERNYRLATSRLNKLAESINRSLPAYKGRQTRVLYMTQVSVSPPHFVLFLNYTEPIRPNHLRYAEKIIRQEHPFMGTPISISIKKRER